MVDTKPRVSLSQASVVKTKPRITYQASVIEAKQGVTLNQVSIINTKSFKL